MLETKFRFFNDANIVIADSNFTVAVSCPLIKDNSIISALYFYFQAIDVREKIKRMVIVDHNKQIVIGISVSRWQCIDKVIYRMHCLRLDSRNRIAFPVADMLRPGMPIKTGTRGHAIQHDPDPFEKIIL
jgi:hypothetical protein